MTGNRSPPPPIQGSESRRRSETREYEQRMRRQSNNPYYNRRSQTTDSSWRWNRKSRGDAPHQQQQPQQQQQQQMMTVRDIMSLKEYMGAVESREDLTKTRYFTEERGNWNSTSFRMYFRTQSGRPISPWHDIPLHHGDPRANIYNMIVEIPRWTNAKMEIATKEPLNPIKQDLKAGKLRYVANFFPYHGYPWNYGAFPQTWENSEIFDRFTKCKGDNDLIDCCEIGEKAPPCGTVLQVKILGCIAMIDQGESDYKIIAIDVNDPMAKMVNDIPDVELHMPKLLKRSVEWLKLYKVPDGKAENKFAFDGAPQCAATAVNILEEAHISWNQLSRKQVKSMLPEVLELDLQRTSNPECNFFINSESCNMIINFHPPPGHPEPRDPEYDKLQYVVPMGNPTKKPKEGGCCKCCCCTIC